MTRRDPVTGASAIPVPTRLAVLISGGGRSLENLESERRAGRLEVTIPLVIASSREAGGVERARRLGLSCDVIEDKGYKGPAEYSEAVFRRIEAERVDLVCLAGFVRLLVIPTKWLGRVINIHPALLPGFGGLGMYGHRVHEAVLKAGARETGCTVHFADNQYDHGPVVLQKKCAVKTGDDAEALAARVFALECEAYPEAIRMIQRGEARLGGTAREVGEARTS